MTEHRLPVDGEGQGVVSLHRGDTIRCVSDVELALDSFGFGRLNVAWRRPIPGCAHGLPWDQDCVACIDIERGLAPGV